MNVLQILHNFPPVWYGGTEIYTLRISQELKKRGVKSIVLTTHRDPAYQPFELLRSDHGGIEVYRLNILENINERFDHEVVQDRVSELINRFRIDVVHLQHLLSWPLSLLYVGKALGLPVVLSVNDFYLICNEIHLIKGRGDQGLHSVCEGPTTIKKCTECFFNEHNEGIYAESDFEAATEYFAARKEFIAGGLETVNKILVPSEFAKEIVTGSGIVEAGQLSLHPLGVPLLTRNSKVHQGVKFVFIGNVNTLKGVDVMVEAFKRADRANTILYIYGSGDKDWLAGLIGDHNSRIKYMGAYLPDELEEIFEEIDCAIMPSMIECYGLCIREALSAGVPVITTQAGGIKDVIVDNVNGFVVDVGDVDAVAEKIIHVSEHIDDVRKMGQNIKLPVSIDADACEMIEIYNDLIKR